MGRAVKRPVPLRMTENLVLKSIPKLTEQEPADRLMEFYRKLGWDGDRVLDPTLVRLHESDIEKIVAEEMDHAKHVVKGVSDLDIAVGVGFLWVNRGPSGGGGVPGFVELHPGWEKEEQ